ncbi:MAG: hypothetical protein M0038_09330 [Pseudomonadota bacterium]|nr:hypothetical protein [Pseudomonadota bacterium]
MMRRNYRATGVLVALCGMLWAGLAAAVPARAAVRPYKNFSVAVYIPVTSTRQLANPQTLRRQFQRIWSQVHFNKVYLEVYRDQVFANPATLDRIAAFFRRRGITVDGGITLFAGRNQYNQYNSFDFENPHDVAICERAVRMAARHFNTIILDDFTFFNTRSNADIKAKGTLSWTEYRLRKMRWVAQHLIIDTAHQVNPRAKVIIKYPNWYEHFQGLGFDLDPEAKMFSGIYTGNETRDPVHTAQMLQQYESYLIYRYYHNIRPHADKGGWVDTFGDRYVDRYAEQLWDTLFAKSPEITLFSWPQLAVPEPVSPGERYAWAADRTSFDWNAMVHAFKAPPGSEAVPGWASVAGYALDKVNKVLGKLGHPIGIASYKPFQSSGEDFLQNYLGNIGIPINLEPHFPAHAPVVLLTAEAAADPDLVAKIEARLKAGGDVIITSGLLHTLEQDHRGIRNVADITYTGLPIAVRHYLGSIAGGTTAGLNVPGERAARIIFPQIRFYTNDSWPVIQGEASAHGVPVLLMTGYSRGQLYVLDVPSNMGDLYRLPEPVLNTLRGYLLARFPVRINAPAHVAEFVYSNDTFVVESYLARPVTVRVFVHRGARELVDLDSGQKVLPAPLITPNPLPSEHGQTSFVIRLAPHSYRAFAVK